MTGPRSRARIFIAQVSLGLGLQICDVSASKAQNKITGQSRQILFEGFPPKTQEFHGFFRTKRLMSNPTVYIESTVIGHIAAWDQTHVLVYARQIQSRRWWANRDRFDLVVSQVVVDECAAGDSIAASERLALIAGLPILCDTQFHSHCERRDQKAD